VGKLPKQTKLRDLIKQFRKLDFTGPHTGVGNHPQYMAKDARVVKLPNPHRGDIGEGLLKKLLDEAGVSEDEWLSGKARDERATEDVRAELPSWPPAGVQPEDRLPRPHHPHHPRDLRLKPGAMQPLRAYRPPAAPAPPGRLPSCPASRAAPSSTAPAPQRRRAWRRGEHPRWRRSCRRRRLC
jgi:predicted RNA binding protein YcfA (HicA-like mRNA interferase family)